MKVLQINATYGYGSTGVITQELTEVCNNDGIKTYVAFPAGKGRIDHNTCQYQIGSPCDHKIHAILSRVLGKQAYFSVRATRRLLKYIDTINPDVVHLHNLHSNYIHLNILLNYLAFMKIKTVITLHDCWFYTGGCFHYTSVGCDKWKYKCGQCIKKKQDSPSFIFDNSSEILEDRYKYLSAISNLTLVGVSRWVESQLLDSRLKDIGKIMHIYNGYDFNIFSPSVKNKKHELGLQDKFVILGPASKWLLPINLEALNYFIGNMPDNAVLLLFGHDGDDINLPDNVCMYGYTKNREELTELYSTADVMVNCSREDTLSSINVESQACGTPVVTYNATGMKETVDDSCGFAIETGNYIELFNKMMHIYNVGKMQYSQSCRNFVKEIFDKERNYKMYIELYKNP